LRRTIFKGSSFRFAHLGPRDRHYRQHPPVSLPLDRSTMGIYDRDYYPQDARDQGSVCEPAGVGRGAPLSMVSRLVLINVALYLFDLLFSHDRHWLQESMALTPDVIAQPLLWWKFVTAGFAHAADPFHVLANMFGLWMFGRDVERVLGRWEFLRFYLLAIVLGNVMWAARAYLTAGPPWASLVGASGAVTAVVMMYALKFPRRTVLLMFAIPVPAWVLGVMIVVFNVFGVNANAAGGANVQIAYDVHLVGAAFGFLYSQLNWKLGNPLPKDLSLGSLVPRSQPMVYSAESQESPADLDHRADQILAKIYREGKGNLTAEERRILKAYSRRMQQKRR
jgi:membrane associated rhomboid family serine protease